MARRMNYIAIDVHSSFCEGGYLDSAGRERDAWHVATAIPPLVEAIDKVPRSLVIEEGPLADWLARNLRGPGCASNPFITPPPPDYDSDMKSYEVIRQATEEPGVKAVAAALHVSAALVYKWCEPPEGAEDPDASGAKNPLDRVREMYQITKDIRLVRYLCNEAGGFYVANPNVPDKNKSLDEHIFTETRGMVREFSELLDTVTESLERTPGIQISEADEIRQKWEDLKACVEKFVTACERGYYTEEPGRRPQPRAKG